MWDAAGHGSHHWCMEEPQEVLLCARDTATVEAVQISAAALDVPLRTTAEPAEIAAKWGGAALRLVGVEVAARWSVAAPGEAFLVGTDPGELARCSALLRLPVIALPDTAGALAAALRHAGRRRPGRAQSLALLSASGGVGVSTLAVALALAAARSGRRAVAVDLAGGGGGLDLVLGAESEPGLRWGDLATARGGVGPLYDGLPGRAGASVVASSRDGGPPDEIAVSTVLDALSDEVDLLTLDCGSGPSPVAVDALLMMISADVRGVAAARMLAESQAALPTGLILRTARHRSLRPAVVERALGVQVLGVVGESPPVLAAAEQGIPPALGRRYRRQVERLLRRVLPHE